MITQFVEELPEGMSTPDFTRKPIALTVQEGKVKDKQHASFWIMVQKMIQYPIVLSACLQENQPYSDQ